MTSMSSSADPSSETKKDAAQPAHEPLHPGAKVGLWLLVATMAMFALGNLRDLIVAILR